MQSKTFDQFMSWNDQLTALVEAGVPVDVGLQLSSPDVPQRLREMAATVTRRVSLGMSLEEALGDEELPAAYRSLMQLALQSGDFSAALAGHRHLADVALETRCVVRAGLVYPLILVMFVYAGLVGFSLFLTPQLADLSRSTGGRSGPALRVAEALRETLPYWAGIPPLLLLAWTVWDRRYDRRRGVASSGTGVGRGVREQRCAGFADALATLVESEQAWANSLQLAASACGDAELRAGASALAKSLQSNAGLADDSTAALRFPPFLRWAIWHGGERLGRARALRIAAAIYRDRALRESQRLRSTMPVFACVLLGGTVTLLYGLVLFLPLVELLQRLAS